MDALAYQYLVGGIVFGAGLVFAWRAGHVGFSGRGALSLLILVGGLLFFLAVQAYLQYAPMETVEARHLADAPPRDRVLGTGIDYAIMIGYFAAILGIGTYFGRYNKTLKDFFLAGQRFSWWLIAFSLIATTVGSYSFVKYSRVAYTYGLSSTQTYFNDWFWMPLLAFGWLPILYVSRVWSIPEYFQRRFGAHVRLWATIIILVYLVSYVGVNLYTMGQALHSLIGWDVFYAAVLVASISAIYVTFGGQTSVIMTDLFQGVMLLGTGLIILVLGIHYLGGFDAFWENLPRGHRTAFANFNEDPAFPSVGIFWQDGMANTAMFYFLNQGIIMRFLAAKSLKDARKAALFMPLVLMPVAACVVASGGWVGRALVHAGHLPADLDARDAFFIAADFLSRPGLFGLIMAALTAALMSTIDTLITAVAAVAVNDIYKPYVRPAATDGELMKVARVASVSVTLVGIALVPVYATFGSIYEAHGAMTAAVTPPLVVCLMLSVFWRRFTAKAAVCTLAGGMGAIVLSLFVPEVIAPFAHGVPTVDAGDGILAGMNQHKYMRACYGLAISTAIAIIVTVFTRPEPRDKCAGLVWSPAKTPLNPSPTPRD